MVRDSAGAHGAVCCRALSTLAGVTPRRAVVEPDTNHSATRQRLEPVRTRSDATAGRSVGIALDLIDAFAGEVELGVSELARRTKVAKSSVSRTCAHLVARGYLERVGSGRFRLGMRLFELGRLVEIRTGLGVAGLEILTELAAAIHHTVHLGVPDGADVVFVERVETSRHLRYASEPWRRSPVHRSSCGKVLAAYLPHVLDARLRAGLPASTGHTIVVPEVLLADLERVRKRGYATNVEESEVGGASLAVPVRNPRTHAVVAALAMAGPTAKVMADEVRLVELLRLAARQLEAAISRGQLAVPAPPGFGLVDR
jgi:DNA-binding IclR family transcriptional regulator